MGYAVATAAAAAGHQVTLLSGPVHLPPPPHCRVVPFVNVDDLQAALAERFADCDALVMAAAVGDFRPERPSGHKLSRSAGAIDLHLIPTQDIVAGVAAGKRPGQIVITFAVEDAPPEAAAAKARRELEAKHADYVVVNMPDAMGAQSSQACILSRDGVILPWGARPKSDLAAEIVSLLRQAQGL